MSYTVVFEASWNDGILKKDLLREMKPGNNLSYVREIRNAAWIFLPSPLSLLVPTREERVHIGVVTRTEHKVIEVRASAAQGFVPGPEIWEITNSESGSLAGKTIEATALEVRLEQE